MRYRVVLVLTTLLFLSSYGIARQSSDDEFWYWAITEDRTAIMAFSGDGEVHSLREFERPIDQIRGWRISSQTALVWLFLGSDTQINLYVLTSTAAHPVVLNFDPEQLHLRSLDERYDFIVWSGHKVTYVNDSTVLVTLNRDTYYDIPLRLLINLNTYTAAPLFDIDLDLWHQDFSGQYSGAADDHIREHIFSEDGHMLRYVYEDIADERLMLRERTLATGEERVIYQTDDLDYLTYQDHHGERWLFSRPDWSSAEMVYENGTSQPAAIQLADDVNLCLLRRSGRYIERELSANCTEFSPRNGNVFVTPAICDVDCPIRVYLVTTLIDVLTLPDSSQRASDFNLNAYRGVIYYDWWLLGSGRLLTYVSGGQYWILRRDGSYRFLGQDSPQPSHTYDDGGLSLDRRWLLVVLEDGNHYGIWNLEAETLAFEDELDDTWLYTSQFDEGMTFTEYRIHNEPDKRRLFRFADGSVIELDRGYFDILSDATMLYELVDNPLRAVDVEDGVYRYDPGRNLSVTLVENVDMVGLAEMTRP